jgi:hypothetical protein
VPIEVAIALLEGDLGSEIASELRQLPIDVDLSDDRAYDYVADGGPADRAWRLLKDCDQVGWVTAGKVLARKRPRLIPVYDNVVRCVYGSPRGFWLWLHGQLRADGAVLIDRLRELHRAADLPAAISPLRTLDVVVWMRHRRTHLPHRCGGLDR